MGLRDVQCDAVEVSHDVIAEVDHKALRDVILGCVQNGNQAHGVR